MLVCTGKCCQGVDFVAKAHISYTHDWSKIVQRASSLQIVLAYSSVLCLCSAMMCAAWLPLG